MPKGGGGSSSGNYTTAGYMSQMHCMMMLGINPYIYKSSKRIGFDDDEYEARDPLNLYDAIRAAASGDSPYAGETAYDPGTLIAAGSSGDSGDELYRVQARIEDLRSLFFTGTDIASPASGVMKDAGDIWLSFLTSAESSDMVDTLVEDYEDKTLPQHARAVGRLMAGFAAANALDPGTATIAKAMIEMERVRGLNEFRNRVIDDAAAKMLVIWQFMGQMMQNMIAAQLQASQMSIVAKIDQWRTNVDLGVLDTYFDIDVWTRGGNLLGSITGSVSDDSRDTGPTKMQSALAGTAAGAGLAIAAGASFAPATIMGVNEAGAAMAMGAQGGAFGGPLGILAGAAIGGLAGLLSS